MSDLTPSAQKLRQNTKALTLCALFAALTAVCSQFQIAIPFVPINLALLSVHLAGALLGPKYGPVSMAVYALMGLIGVPVFAGFGSGPGVLFGKTGGYIVGYILCALTVGLLTRLWGDRFSLLCAAMALGVLLCYLFGTLWFMAVAGLDLFTSLGYCVFPFLPGDAVKILLASLLAKRLRGPLARAGWTPA
ncbi:MAG: biotin transporter BioY [Oscillospiraceae bacterium]|nr:biotin transporter BioY [Oscillospiraceae bacterium]